MALLLRVFVLFFGFACGQFGGSNLAAEAAEPETGRTLADADWSASIPFAFDQNQVIVEAWINGEGPFRLQLDTGVYPSVINDEVAKRAGLRLSGPQGQVAGLGGEAVAYRSSIVQSISFGDHAVQDLPVIVARTRHLQLAGGPVEGTLGESFFRRRAVQIDYPARRIRLAPSGALGEVEHRPDSAVEPGSRSCLGAPLAIDFSGRVPRLLDVEVDGKTATAWLDTGSSVGLLFSSATLRHLGLEHLAVQAKPVEGQGSRGRFTGSLVMIPALRLGSIRKPDVPTVLAPMGGIWIGNGFLGDLVLTLDYKAGRGFLDDPRTCDPPPIEPTMGRRGGERVEPVDSERR